MVRRFNKGFTLTELLIVLAILAILVSLIIGIINPISLAGRANDAERKRDLDMIKKTFEEYYNDYGHYPCEIADWNTEDNCQKNLSQFKYLQPWPCDPLGSPYYISVSTNCKSYRVMTNLEYKADKVIPDGWYDEDNELYRVEGYSPEDYNYGVSSADQDWDDYSLDDNCNGVCSKESADGECNAMKSIDTCDINGNPPAFGCYLDSNCSNSGDVHGGCQVTCCGPGCN